MKGGVGNDDGKIGIISSDDQNVSGAFRRKLHEKQGKDSRPDPSCWCQLAAAAVEVCVRDHEDASGMMMRWNIVTNPVAGRLSACRLPTASTTHRIISAPTYSSCPPPAP